MGLSPVGRQPMDSAVIDEPCCKVPTSDHPPLRVSLVIRGLGLGLLGSACCAVPVLLVALGLAGLAGLRRYVAYAPLISMALMLGMLYGAVRRSSQGVFSLEAVWRMRTAIVAVLCAFGVMWGLMVSGMGPVLVKSAARSVRRSFSGQVVTSAFRSGLLERPERTGPKDGIVGQRLVLRIEGMYCGGCIGAVASRLNGLRGVWDVEVWMGGASLTYDAAVVSSSEIAGAATFYAFKAAADGVTDLR